MAVLSRSTPSGWLVTGSDALSRATPTGWVHIAGAGGGGTTYTLSTATYAPGSLTATGVTPRVTVTVA